MERVRAQSAQPSTEGVDCGEEETDQCGGRGVPQVHHPVQAAHFRIVGRGGPEIARGIGASPVTVGHSFESSAEVANLLQESVTKRRAGVAESVPTNP